MQNTSNTETVSTPTASSTPSSPTSSTVSATPQASSTTTTSSDNNSEMVWVGNTGTKYHNEGCRTLKGNGHQITMKQALSEGREACKVCH